MSLQRTKIEFLEIERKYIVPDDLSPLVYIERIHELEPLRQSTISVQDTYFVTKTLPGYVYRHRIDEEWQHLTLKSLEEDSEIRLEVNLDLGLHASCQLDRVKAFLEPLNVLWQASLSKEVKAFYFEKAELVHYLARYADRLVSCIEIEAKNCASTSEAMSVIDHYENLLQISRGLRSKRSLFHIMFEEDLRKTLGDDADAWLIS